MTAIDRLRALYRKLPPATTLVGLAVVAAVRLLTLPKSLWEHDEFLFVQGVLRFDPLHHHPHPPGYPLLIGLGKLFALLTGDPFRGLVALAVLSSLVGFLALAATFRLLAAGRGATAAEAERVGVIGSLLVHLSPALLVHGPLPMSDPPALAFLSLALLAAARLAGGGGGRSAVALGAFASAAVGCRPQLALAVLPMLAVAVWLAPTWRARLRVAAAFTVVSLAWLLPLLLAVGGPRALLAWEAKQTVYVVAHDAAQSRIGRPLGLLAARFLAHPWGTRFSSLPVLALAGLGAVALARRRDRRVLPLATLTVVHLLTCLLLMDPWDGVRYALPALPGVAFAAAFGCVWAARWARAPRLAWAPLAVVAGLGALYASPVLAARTRIDSPPVQAARFLRDRAPAGSVVLVEPSLRPHAELLLHGYELLAPEAGLEAVAARGAVPVWLLGNGDSGWPDVERFAWPESNAYGKLTRDQYRVVTASPIPPARRYQVVRGVYQLEPSAREAAWRWLGPDAAIRVWPAGKRGLRLVLGLSKVAPLATNPVTVRIDGGAPVGIEVVRGERRTLVVPLPVAATVLVELSSAQSYVPAELKLNADTRRLAVQLLEVELLDDVPVSSRP